MKILILYTTRCGTNSIADYFMKQNTDYVYFNQPFSSYGQEGITYTTYDKCISYDNVLVKSEIGSFDKLNIDRTKLLKDFDKVLLISRKDKKEQSISYLIAEETKNFLNKRKRGYYIENMDNDILAMAIQRQTHYHSVLETYTSEEIPLFYYEDLYYGDFSKLFKFLNIEHIDSDFENILNTKNKYRDTELYSKKTNTII